MDLNNNDNDNDNDDSYEPSHFAKPYFVIV